MIEKYELQRGSIGPPTNRSTGRHDPRKKRRKSKSRDVSVLRATTFCGTSTADAIPADSFTRKMRLNAGIAISLTTGNGPFNGSCIPVEDTPFVAIRLLIGHLRSPSPSIAVYAKSTTPLFRVVEKTTRNRSCGARYVKLERSRRLDKNLKAANREPFVCLSWTTRPWIL